MDTRYLVGMQVKLRHAAAQQCISVCSSEKDRVQRRLAMGGAGSALKVLKFCPGGAQEGFAVGAAAARMVQGGAHLARNRCSGCSTRRARLCVPDQGFWNECSIRFRYRSAGREPGPQCAPRSFPSGFWTGMLLLQAHQRALYA